MLPVTPSKATKMVEKVLMAKLVPFLKGSPGVGKSSLIREVADKYKLQVIDLRLSQCEPTDLLGIPLPDGKEKVGYKPFNTFPIEGDSIPEGKDGWLLFLDEFSSAPPAVQAAAYKLTLDRMVGAHNLHKNVAVVCAGNKDTDNAIVEDMSTALQSRLIHIELDVSYEEWCDWGIENDIDYRIISFIKYKPNSLMLFDPNHSDCTYPCPRTWEFASRLLENLELDDATTLPLLAGTLGEGTAREFLGFTRIYKSLPTIEDILANPEKITVPKEASTLFALTGLLAVNTNAKTIDNIFKYIKRMPGEFQVITVKEMRKRDDSLISTPQVLEWSRSTAREFLS